MKSVRSKIILMMLCAIVIPLTAVGLFSINRISNMSEEMVIDHLQDLSKLTAQSIHLTVGDAERVTHTIADNSVLASAATGMEYYRNPAYSLLNAVQEDNSDLIESLILINNKGLATITNSEIRASIDLSDRPYVQEVLQGKPSKSDVIISRATGEPIIAIAYPLENNGVIKGAIISTILFSNITDHIDGIQVFDSGYAYLFDHNGLTIHHPDESKRMTFNLHELNSEAINNMIAEVASGLDGSAHYTYNDVYKYVDYIPVESWGLAVTADYDDYMAASREVQFLIIGIGLFAAILATLISNLYVNRGIVKPLRKIVGEMKKAGDGDLTASVTIKTNDEIQSIGEAFNDMIATQNHLIENVQSSSQELAGSSEEMAEMSTQLSLSADDVSQNIMSVAENVDVQSKTIIETSEVLLQLSSLIQLARSSAITSNESADKTIHVVDDGRVSVDDTINAMNDIQDGVTETGGYLQEIERMSDQVRGIIDTINSIAEQTNLLALNASIEAARAGDHGRGFAVVAEEVRILAEQTGKEATTISQVIVSMDNKIQQAVNSMDNGLNAVQTGVVKTQSTDNAFMGIQNSINEITDSVQQIVNVTADEVASSDAIIKLIDQIASLSEVNATKSQVVAAETEEQTALSENLAASSEELTAMANQMNEMVARFKL